MSKQEQISKRLENATRTLANFEVKNANLSRRLHASRQSIATPTERVAKKQTRTDQIRQHPATKQSTIDNNTKFIAKRSAQLLRKKSECDSLEGRITTLVTKIEKKKKVVIELTRKLTI